MSSTIFNALHEGDVDTLLALIKECPTWETVNHIISTFPAVAQAYPTETLKIAETIYETRQSAESLAVISDPDDSDDEEELDLDYELQICVYEMLSSAFDIPIDSPPPGYTEITPTHEFLIAALISGACERIGLCRSSDQTGMVCEGFQLPGYTHMQTDELWQELFAIHACLALLVGGSRMYRMIRDTEPKKLVSALRRLEDEDVIKIENGKKLLQLTIRQVESAFITEVDIKDIWATLFPKA